MTGENRAWRPPAAAWVLAPFVDTRGPEPARPARDPALLQRLAWPQLALGTLIVAATVLLGRALLDARTGLVAGALVALYPALVVQSHYLWSENLYVLLLLLGLLGIVAVAQRPGWGRVALTGLVFGLATLTRELALGIAGLGALWWLWRAAPAERGAALARGAMLIGVAMLVVLPWTLRNHQLFGRLVPVSTIGWYALAEGNSLERPEWLERFGPVQARFRVAYFSERDEMARLDLARRHFFERVRAEQPAWLGKKLVRNLSLLLTPDSLLRRKIRHGAYGEVPPPRIRGLLAASIPSHLALVTLGVLGLAAAPSGKRALPVAVLAAICLVHVLANAAPRFRLPLLPLLAIYAAFAVLHARSLWRMPSRGGWIAATAVLAFFFGVCVPYYHRVGGWR